MKTSISIAAAALAIVAALSPFATRPAAAGVEFGKPEFPNYLSLWGHGTCDWWTSAYLRACPTAAGSAPVAGPAPGNASTVVPAKGNKH
jgi:hypothetical protein